MLNINNLSAKIENKQILNGLNLDIKAGEIHAIMGPNGSGKSTLANVLSGKKGYEITGNIKYQNKDLFKLDIEERAHKGLFLAFQYPLEIPGVNTSNFLKTSLNAIRKSKKLELLQKAHKNGNLDNFNLCKTCFIIDDRINTVFNGCMQYFLFMNPSGDASYCLLYTSDAADE